MVRSHNKEVKSFKEQLKKDYIQQEAGYNEQGNVRVGDNICQPKEGLEEIRGENLGDLILNLEPRRMLPVLREGKGRKSA